MIDTAPLRLAIGAENQNVARYLPLMARERPDQVAVVTGADKGPGGAVAYEQLSFAELDRESDRYAWGLSGYGFARGERVLLMVRAGLPLISLTYALLKLGCVPILIDPAMGRRNLAQCIAECAPTALVGVPRAHLARLIFRRAFSTVQRAVTVGRRLPWGGVTLDDLRPAIDTPFPMADLPADAPAAIIFTTGSTGVPKGVLYEHGMFNAQITLLGELFQFEPGEVEMPAFPLFALFNVALGVTSAIPPIDPTRPASCDPAEVIRFMQDQRVTSTFGSPAIWAKVTAHCVERGITLPHLRRVLMAGAPVPAFIHERFLQILDPASNTYTPYGATEALPIAAASGREVLAAHAERDTPTAGTCVGRPAPGVTMRVIQISDTPIQIWDEALALPPYQVGEICVKGAMVTRTYINRPQSTAQAKIAEGDATWHRMGDLGYFDVQGRLWFCGRKSHRVETADGPLFTEPVELVFNQHPAVARSALVGVRRGQGGGGTGETRQGALHAPAPATPATAPAAPQTPVLIVELKPGQAPRTAAERERLFGELRELGGRYEMTAGIVDFLIHPAFPVDIRHNAKIFREKLAVWAEHGRGKR